MNRITEVSKYKAKLDGRLIRLSPVKSNQIRAGKWYIRSFDQYSELIYCRGQAFRAPEIMYKIGYTGKQRIKTVYVVGWGLQNRESYLSDMGAQDVKHYCGATLFEFNANALALLTEMSKAKNSEYRTLMGHDPDFESLDDIDY